MCKKCDPFIEQAEAFCAKQGLRLTVPRAQVLGIVVESGRAMTAYEILDQLGHLVKNPKPPTVYRALEFLLETGLIHRIESRNAYIACHHAHADFAAHATKFLICDECGDVTEMELKDQPMDKGIENLGFVPNRSSTEIHGLCAQCRA